jgi:TonB family protein
MNVLMLPDSVHGTIVWMAARPTGDPASDQRKDFVTAVNPSITVTWVEKARSFLKVPLSDSDTGSLRLSIELPGQGGDGLLLARRRVDGKWSNERIIILQNHGVERPWMVVGRDQEVGQFLDALESTAGRTVISQDAAARDSVALSNPFDADGDPIPDPQNQPPAYSESLRRQNIEGEVWVSFVVTAEGRADLNTLRILLSDERGFDNAVRQSLRASRYTPAMSNGAPVPKRVFQRFSFALRRPQGFDRHVGF